MHTKRAFLFTLLASLALGVFGQSTGILHHLELPYQKTGPLQMATPNKFARSVTIADSALPTPTTDSTFVGLRLTGVTVLVAVPNWSLYTGTGISYEKDVYSSTTKRWTTTWAVNVGVYLGGQFAPTTLKTVGALGASVALFNKFLVVGVLYNFAGPQHFQAATGGNAAIIPTN